MHSIKNKYSSSGRTISNNINEFENNRCLAIEYINSPLLRQYKNIKKIYKFSVRECFHSSSKGNTPKLVKTLLAP